jgi:WD40 repeat protein
LHAPAPPFSSQAQVVSSQAAAHNSTLAPSYLLHSRYSIVSQVGTGGFGAVYKAKDTLFSNRAVAIKEMSQDGLSPRELAEATAAFEHEALLLADLAHPNLPRIHDHFSEQGRTYVVMDFIAGETLEDYLDKFVRRFPPEGALDIAIQLAAALDYLHTRQPPIIFRDLKPANIMLTSDNHVYLIDFGIARHFKAGKAKDTIPLGSKGYAAPEQYGKAQSSPQTDIYGLGATLHQLLTGNDPSLNMFRFDPVKLRNSPITKQLNDLLKEMVEMEMGKRPASMAVVRQRLQQLLAQQTAQNVSASQKSARAKVGRRKFLLGFASVILTCSGSSAITAYLFNRQDALATIIHPLIGDTPSLSPTTSATFPAGTRILSKPLYTYLGHSGSVTAVAWSPRGNLIASSGTVDSSVQIWKAKTGTLTSVPVLEIDASGKKQPFSHKEPALFTIEDQSVSTLAWTSDATRLAAALDNESVEIWNLKTGENNLFSSSQPGNANAVAWSPDGSIFAAVSGNNTIQVRAALTGKLLSSFSDPVAAVFTLVWSPGGKHIASGDADGIVYVWDAATGNKQILYPGHTAAVNVVTWSPDGSLIASGSADGTVQLCDAATGKGLYTYKGHRGRVTTVAWQPVAKQSVGSQWRIASAGADDTVQVWAVSAGTQTGSALTLQGDILLYRGHSAQVLSVSWSPDGTYIASGGEDGTVQLWQAM